MRFFINLFRESSSCVTEPSARCAGFTLLIVPVFFIVMAYFTVSIMEKSETRSFQSEARTQIKMERARMALANYATRNYRVPCPADPAATGANLGTETACNAVSREGILPFRALGLSAADARDEWGRYFTYTVSPSFTNPPLVAGRIPSWHYNNPPANALPVPLTSNVNDYVNTNSTGGYSIYSAANRAAIADSFVHEYCRRTGSWLNINMAGHRDDQGDMRTFRTLPDIDYKRNINKNAYKAQFCCASNVGSFMFFDFTSPLVEAQIGTPENPPPSPVLTYTVQQAEQDLDGDPVTPVKNFSIGIKASQVGTDACEMGFEKKQSADMTPADIRAAFACVHSTANYSNFVPLAWGTVQHGDSTSGSPWRGGIAQSDHPTVHGHYYKNYDNTISFSIADGDGHGVSALTLGFTDMEGEEKGSKVLYSAVLQVVQDDGTVVNIPGMHDAVTDFPGTGQGGGATFEITAANFLDYDPALQNFMQTNGYKIQNLKIRQLDYYSLYQSMQISNLTIPPQTPLNTDLQILDTNGAPRLPPRSSAGYRPADEQVIGTIDTAVAAPAYALVSHGANGAGAYLVNGTNNRVPVVAGSIETENTDGDNIILDSRKIVADTAAQSFDDIVLWDSQISLYHALSNSTCDQAL